MQNTLLGIVVVALIGIGAYLYMSKPAEAPAPQQNTDMSSGDAMMESNTDAESSMDSMSTMEDGTLDVEVNVGGEVSTTPATKSYTKAEVAMHKDASSCWSIIEGNIYDLTSWIPQHPGGERNILKICGIDGTSAFEGQHGANAKAQVKRDEFFIGVLAQ